MGEQWTWEPVKNKTDIRCACESTDCSKALIVAYDEMQIYDVHMGGGFSFLLPDDIRLCRRVPAPAQGVPVEAIRTLREYGIPLGTTYAKWHKACQEVQRWLDAQPQTGQDAL